MLRPLLESTREFLFTKHRLCWYLRRACYRSSHVVRKCVRTGDRGREVLYREGFSCEIFQLVCGNNLNPKLVKCIWYVFFAHPEFFHGDLDMLGLKPECTDNRFAASDTLYAVVSSRQENAL